MLELLVEQSGLVSFHTSTSVVSAKEQSVEGHKVLPCVCAAEVVSAIKNNTSRDILI